MIYIAADHLVQNGIHHRSTTIDDYEAAPHGSHLNSLRPVGDRQEVLPPGQTTHENGSDFFGPPDQIYGHGFDRIYQQYNKGPPPTRSQQHRQVVHRYPPPVLQFQQNSWQNDLEPYVPRPPGGPPLTYGAQP